MTTWSRFYNITHNFFPDCTLPSPFPVCLPCNVCHTAVLFLHRDLTWFTVKWFCVERSLLPI